MQLTYKTYRRPLRGYIAALGVCLVILLHAATVHGQAAAASKAPPPAAATAPAAPAVMDERRLLLLGPGDSVGIDVYGQPDMTTTVYVADDGSISVPLAGAVKVSGLSPVEAAGRVENALRKGQFLVDPHVTLTVTTSRSQRVSVLGMVKTPGRYPIEPNTTVFDLLAEAGGVTDASADVIYILRPDAAGVVTKYPVNVKGFSDRKDSPLPTQTLLGGDSVFVPRAEQFYIYGEVTTPNMYRIEPGMTVVQALAKAGGVTVRGSDRRIEIKRLDGKGQYVIIHAKLGDLVKADDVIRVKESIF